MLGLRETTEVNELTKKRFSTSPLGMLKMEAVESIKIVESVEIEIVEIVENAPIEGKHTPIEGNNGSWTGERGNSQWQPDKDYTPKKDNPNNETWGEILDDAEIDGITFEDGDPDFSEVAEETVEIDGFSTERADNFDKADKILADKWGMTPSEVRSWRKDNGYTWHECSDMKTMELVPKIIHSNISHSGGISQAKLATKAGAL